MGLHMYLCRTTRKNIEDLKHLKEIESDLNKIWEPIIANELPKNWYCDKSNMPENQRKLYDEMYNEFDIIEQKRSAILNEMNAMTVILILGTGEISIICINTLLTILQMELTSAS